MAIRTKAPEVLEILEEITNLTEAIIEPFIAVASMLVDEIAVTDPNVSAARLKEIERWLTAHIVTVAKERRPIEEEIGNDTAIKYSDVYGPGLQSTDYGQMAATLDTTGVLAARGKKRVDIVAITSFE